MMHSYDSSALLEYLGGERHRGVLAEIHPGVLFAALLGVLLECGLTCLNCLHCCTVRGPLLGTICRCGVDDSTQFLGSLVRDATLS